MDNKGCIIFNTQNSIRDTRTPQTGIQWKPGVKQELKQCKDQETFRLVLQ